MLWNPPSTTDLLRDDYRWTARWYSGGTQNYKGTKRRDGFTYECILDYNRRENEVKISLSFQGYSDSVMIEAEPKDEWEINDLIERAEGKLDRKVRSSLSQDSDDYGIENWSFRTGLISIIGSFVILYITLIFIMGLL